MLARFGGELVATKILTFWEAGMDRHDGSGMQARFKAYDAGRPRH
jgi:hypothetical protein